jgi:hypothetical protein
MPTSETGKPADGSTDESKKKRCIFRALKLSWRSPGRDSEREIHRLIKCDFFTAGREQPTTIAMLDDDSLNDLAYEITQIAETRGDGISQQHGLSISSGDNILLTCTIFARVGKAIWQYDSHIEFLRGARDILKGEFRPCAHTTIELIHIKD